MANILKAVPALSWCLSDSLAQQRGHVSRALKTEGNTPKYGLISTLASLAEQLPRTKAAAPNTWQTNAGLPQKLIASLR